MSLGADCSFNRIRITYFNENNLSSFKILQHEEENNID